MKNKEKEGVMLIIGEGEPKSGKKSKSKDEKSSEETLVSMNKDYKQALDDESFEEAAVIFEEMIKKCKKDY